MSVTLTPSTIYPTEEIVRVDGYPVGRVRRFRDGYTGTTIATGTVVASGVDKATAVQMVVADHREFEHAEDQEEALGLAVERDQEAYRRAVEADEAD